MLQILILVALVCSASPSVFDEQRSVPRLLYSAATPAQIRFAVDSKYDDTGPGAKDPDSNLAYRTYKTAEEALVAYLDDPDTKLPEQERARALDALNGVNALGPRLNAPEPYRQAYWPRYQHVHHNNQLTLNQVDLSDLRRPPVGQWDPLQQPGAHGPFSWQKLQEVRPKTISLSHYTRRPEPETHYGHYDAQAPLPAYDSYDNAADSARVSEYRHLPYRGYYIFRDRSGQRTLRFTGDTQPLNK